MLKKLLTFLSKNKLLALLIVSAFVFFMITIWPSGNHYCYKAKCGLFYWGSNEHDAIWHLALAEGAFKQIPFILPIFSGIKLIGYNYLIDFIIYLLKLIHIPSSFSYFQFFPFVWFIVFTYLLIRLARSIKNSPLFTGWLLFFCYFGASFSYFFTLYHQRTIWGSSSLVAMQSGNMLTNMPFALSLLILLGILLIMKKHRITWIISIILGFLVCINLGLKLYSGLIGIIIIFTYYFFDLLQRKKKISRGDVYSLIKKYFVIVIFFFLAVFIFYNPFESIKSGSIFIFSPFATMHSMIEEPVFFYLKDLTNARYYLYAHRGLLSPRLIGIELFSTGLFLFFSLGLRIFGLFYFIVKALQRKLNAFEASVFISALAAFVFLVLFIQKGQWWNVIQFYYYSLFLMNIFTALFFYELLRKQKNKIIVFGISLFAIILTLPPNIDILKTFTSFPPSGYVSNEEMKALDFLKMQPEGIVFTPFYDAIFQKYDPQPLYIKQNSSYISAFSGKQAYYADEIQLSLFGIPYEERRDRIQKADCSILQEVTYIYLIKNERSAFINTCINNPEFSGKQIFENDSVIIYSERLSK